MIDDYIQLSPDFYEKGLKNNWQILTHGNGDAAIDQMIRTLGPLNKKYGNEDRRNVLIHGQYIREDQLDSLKQMDVIASLFPLHTFYWGDWHKEIIGDSLGNKGTISTGDVQWMTAGKGVDVVYDPVGGPFSELALRDMAWNGRFLVVGFAAGEIPKIPLNLALLKGCQIVGVFWGRFTATEPEANAENMAELSAWLKSGKIKPLVSKTYQFDEAALAIRDLMERRAKGKICLVTS